MKNWVQEGNVITLAAPYDRLSGQGALVGSIFGVAAGDVLSGVDGEFAVQGVFDLPNPTSGNISFTQGALGYWDNSAKNVTTTSSGNTKIGAATEAAGTSAAIVRIRLNGSF